MHMNKSEVVQTIRDVGVIPVVRAQSADEAMMAIDAIREGGISLLEITMTVPGAVGVIEKVCKRFGAEALVGAGAVGGASYLKALKAPLPQIELVPTGGVSLQTAADFIKAGASALGVGTDLVDLTALRDGQQHIIT